MSTLHPFTMREKLGIGADLTPQSAIVQTFFFHFSSSCSVALRHQRRFSPIPRQTLALSLARSPPGTPRPLSCTIRRLCPIFERYALLETLCVLIAVAGVRARAASRAVIYLRSRVRLTICRRMLSRAINVFFFFSRAVVTLPSARVGFRFHCMTAAMGGFCWNHFPPSVLHRICDSYGSCESFPPSLANIWD